MRRTLTIILYVSFVFSIGLMPGGLANAQQQGTVSGTVFHDISGTGEYNPSEDLPLPGVAVSNGRDVVVTDNTGKYSLPLRDNTAIFVIKPRNWSVPVNESQIPQFFYMHMPEGATGRDFMGMEPTGKLSGPVNFPLYPSAEPDQFEVLVFGDTQPRDHQEIYYLSNDVLSGLSDIDAAFGITLGDIVFDDLDLFDHLKSAISTVGIPWRYVLGNHDIDFSADNNTDARGAWYRTFGPSWYSFGYGPVHFILLDNIRWIVDGDKRFYRTGLGSDQMEFLKNEFERIDKDQLIVLLTHIPWTGSTAWYDLSEREALFELLASHPRSVSLVAHTHRHFHDMIGKEEGFPGDEPHHMVSVGTVCGAWWTGAPDEYGIPHAMMADGTPASYTFLHVDGNRWKMSWRASRRPAEFQMHIHAPDMVKGAGGDKVTVTANIFNALPSAEVEMRIGNGNWVPMTRTPGRDPGRLEVMRRERSLGDDVPWRHLGGAQDSEHIWIAESDMPSGPGVYVIEVRASDDWWDYNGRRLIHVE